MSLMEARKTPEYNCCHFVADAWRQETGQDVSEPLLGFMRGKGARYVEPHIRFFFTRLARPQDLCIVLMRRSRAAPHVGIYVRGKIFHLSDRGPIRQEPDVATMGYRTVRYYDIRSVNH